MQKFNVTLTVGDTTQTEQYDAHTSEQALFIAGVGLALSYLDNSPVGDLLASAGASLSELNEIIKGYVTSNQDTVEWDYADEEGTEMPQWLSDLIFGDAKDDVTVVHLNDLDDEPEL